jgi:hypothetical protein
MAYGVDEYPDPPEHSERPEREYDADSSDRFKDEANRDCEAAIASIKSMNAMLDSIFNPLAHSETLAEVNARRGHD